jgi:hypothetical protein
MTARRRILACSLLLALFTQSGVSGQVPSSGDVLSWQEYPDVEELSQLDTITTVFPEYDLRQPFHAEYSEYLPYYQPPLGLVTCTSQYDAYVALIHYSGDGRATLYAAGLPLPAGDEVTLSFELTTETPGLSRLLLWSYPPDEAWLNILAQYPNWVEEPVPGVLSQQWFSGGNHAVFLPPWDDPWRPAADQRWASYAGAQLLCWAKPLPVGTVQAKDCAVLFTGTVSTGFDEYGIRAYWELDWAAELELVLVLPSQLEGAHTELFLYGEDTAGSTFLAEPELTIAVNGWVLDEMDAISLFREPGEPTIASLSRYTVSGENHIELLNSTFTDSALRLGEIEVWVY